MTYDKAWADGTKKYLKNLLDKYTHHGTDKESLRRVALEASALTSHGIDPELDHLITTALEATE